MKLRILSTIFLIGGIIPFSHAADPLENYTPPMDVVSLPAKGNISYFLKSVEAIDGSTGNNLFLYNYNYDNRNLPAGYNKYNWDKATSSWVDAPSFHSTRYEWNLQDLCARNGDTTFEYDQYGRVIRSITSFDDEVNQSYMIEYTYNNTGKLLTEKTSYLKNGKPTPSTLTTYTYVQTGDTYTSTIVYEYYDEAGTVKDRHKSIEKIFDDKTTRIGEWEFSIEYDGVYVVSNYEKAEWKYPLPNSQASILVYNIRKQLRDDVLATVFESNATISQVSEKQWKVTDIKHSFENKEELFQMMEEIQEEINPGILLIVSQRRWEKRNAADDWELISKSETSYFDSLNLKSITVIFYKDPSNSRCTEYFYNDKGYHTEQNIYKLLDGEKIPYQHYQATLHGDGPTVTDYLVQRYNPTDDTWWTEQHFKWEYNFDVSINNVQNFGIVNDDNWYANYQFMLLKHYAEEYGVVREYSYSYEKSPDLGSVEEITDLTSAPIRYYTLQGLPVDESQLKSGIYIKCQGSHAEKIIVR